MRCSAIETGKRNVEGGASCWAPRARANSSPAFRFPSSALLLALLLLAIGATSAVSDDSTEPAPVAIPWGPFLQNPTPTAVTILWATNTPNKGSIVYGTAANRMDRTLTATEQTEGRNVLTLTDLEPATKYHYRVVSTPLDGRPPVESETATFITPATEYRHFTFAIQGDVHQSNCAGELAQLLSDQAPDFILDLGDRNPSIVGGLFRPYREVLQATPIYFARGNHDAEHKQAMVCTMPGPGAPSYYAFTRGNARFFCVFSTDRKDLAEGSEQYRWLEDELKSCKETWRFVFQHIPVYSAHRDGLSQALDDERALLEKYNVHVVFQGHMHHYDRTFPLRDNKVVSTGGVTYVTVSGSCGGSYPFKHSNRAWFLAKRFRGAPFIGIGVVNDKKATFHFMTSQGAIFDTLELTAK